jgi:hypothetical protein
MENWVIPKSLSPIQHPSSLLVSRHFAVAINGNRQKIAVLHSCPTPFVPVHGVGTPHERYITES